MNPVPPSLHCGRLCCWRLLWTGLLTVLAGCTPGATGQPPSASRPTIVATTGMVADMVQAIVGDEVRVVALMAPGVDPHLYRPTRSDVKRMLEADVVVYSGLMLEGRMAEAFTHLARGGKTVVAVTDHLDPRNLRRLEETPGHQDPHLWMDVAAWSECTGHVADRLADWAPGQAMAYRQRAVAYQQRLQDLDERIAAAIATIPERQRVLITAHDAFGYFSRRYGIPVRSVQGVTTESEAGVGDINALVNFIVSREVPAIFVESSVNPQTIHAVCEGAQARGVAVVVGAELYSDAMGPQGTYEGTYPGMMDANATRIVRALGGTIAERGLYNRLTPGKQLAGMP